jgi:hypothetical protein
MLCPKIIFPKVPVLFVAGIFLLQTIASMAYGQSLPNFVQDDFQHKINLYDVNGRPIANEAPETQGSPLFVTKWKPGWIRLADSRFFPGVQLKLDLQKQVVHYKRGDGDDIEVEPGQVKELAILDTVAGVAVLYQFVSGFQPIDNQTAISFYLLLDSGGICLFESLRKELKQDKDDFSGETHREYAFYSDYYVFHRGQMVRIKKDLKFFVELTNDKHDQMEDYLKKNKVSFKSAEDIRQFIHYYNGLP